MTKNGKLVNHSFLRTARISGDCKITLLSGCFLIFKNRASISDLLTKMNNNNILKTTDTVLLQAYGFMNSHQLTIPI